MKKCYVNDRLQVKMTAFHNTRQNVINSRESATLLTPDGLYTPMFPGSSHSDDDDTDESDHC